MQNELPRKVTLVEVGIRDGLQNESAPVTTEQKIALLGMLTEAGLRRLEAGSFVSPRWVPQMADTAAVFAGLPEVNGVTYRALTPNEKGLEAALAANVKEVAVLVQHQNPSHKKTSTVALMKVLPDLNRLSAKRRQRG